jgi:hypothetical protein
MIDEEVLTLILHGFMIVLTGAMAALCYVAFFDPD